MLSHSRPRLSVQTAASIIFVMIKFFFFFLYYYFFFPKNVAGPMGMSC